jgi:hypothetical protein
MCLQRQEGPEAGKDAGSGDVGAAVGVNCQIPLAGL